MLTLQLDTSLRSSDGTGTQRKIWIDPQNLIKINTKKQEAIKEVTAYKLGKAMGLNCAYYELISVKDKARTYQACRTTSFLEQDEIEITVNTILDAMNVVFSVGEPAINIINKTILAISDYTGFSHYYVTTWIYDMLVFDYLICNDDRHLTNFEVLSSYKKGRFRLAPYFDHGSSFLGTDRELGFEEYKKRVRALKSKPFSTNPLTNLGDRALARASFYKMMEFLGGLPSGAKEVVKTLGLPLGHVMILYRRIDELVEHFDTVASAYKAKETRHFS